ncbi:hypothetical protein BaRGS_00000843 [Batillaria attramentaria]|uniref:Uncharacterized protein n=1 Tax=Batillaria attramentaria TaxID=370345 RepID=A0ABD0M7U9_9CAEN
MPVWHSHANRKGQAKGGNYGNLASLSSPGCTPQRDLTSSEGGRDFPLDIGLLHMSGQRRVNILDKSVNKVHDLQE